MNRAGKPIHSRVLVCYGLPALPLAALVLPLYMVIPAFYTETLGLSLAGVGLVLLLMRFFDAVNDPVIGVLADRVDGPIGRRRSWFAAAVPVIMASAWMLFWPPATAGLAHLAFWGVVLSIGFTAASLSYSAWGAEASNDYHQKSRIVGFRESFALVGTLLAVGLPFTIGWKDASEFHGLALLAVLIVVALPVAVGLAIFAMPELPRGASTPLPIKSSMKLLRGNKPFLRLIIAFIINGLANALPATLFLFFVSARLGQPDARGPLLFVYFAVAIIGVIFWTAVSKRYGKHRTWCLAMILACLVFLPVLLVDENGLWLYAIICVASGLCIGADLVLPASMQADVIELDSLKSGDTRSGLFFALWSLATKLSLALAVGIAFPLLDLFGFDPAAPEQSTRSGMVALVALYAVIPIVLKLSAIGIMWHFPLGETELKATKGEQSVDTIGLSVRHGRDDIGAETFT